MTAVVFFKTFSIGSKTRLSTPLKITLNKINSYFFILPVHQYGSGNVFYTWVSIKLIKSFLDNNPTWVAFTWPSLKRMSVGMPRTPNLGGVAGL
ncbi:MAG: hypothetical protein ACD_60C00030G0006 [uncultured bacterium]|nr:MAG: hypothetical protein ACD_60C00030G0006 [uncultured bacterium]